MVGGGACGDVHTLRNGTGASCSIALRMRGPPPGEFRPNGWTKTIISFRPAACCPGDADLLEDVTQAARDGPTRVMHLQLGQIADVADVVALAVLLHVLVDHLLAGDSFGEGECFQNRAAIRTAAAQVIDLSGSWGLDER